MTLQRRILVIDDEPRLAQSLAALLRGVGYDVIAAIGGRAGIEKLADPDYEVDVVITDLRMEDVDGFAVMDYIGKHRPRTAIIVITGHASTESAIEAIHSNVCDYIPKPFDFEFLKASLGKVFARLDAERLRQDTFHMLTHDIKAPLASVLGFAQICLRPDGTLHENTADYLGKILINGQRILGLVDNYLTNARAEEGRLEIIRQPLVVADVLQEVVASLEPELARNALDVRVSLDPAVQIQGDEPLLFRAVANLLSNAAKYAPQESSVWISCSRADDKAVITVENDGCDLAPEEAPQLFERYRRGRSSVGTSGTGLGLHIVRCVAQAHGGAADAFVDPATRRIQFRIALPA